MQIINLNNCDFQFGKIYTYLKNSQKIFTKIVAVSITNIKNPTCSADNIYDGSNGITGNIYSSG